MDLLCFCSVLCLLCLCARLFICALWSPAGKGLTSCLSFVVSNCEFVTFPLVSWVGCGTWLYWLLIFAPYLTLVEFVHVVLSCRLLIAVFLTCPYTITSLFYLFFFIFSERDKNTTFTAIPITWSPNQCWQTASLGNQLTLNLGYLICMSMQKRELLKTVTVQDCFEKKYWRLANVLFDLILYVHSTIFQLCGTGLPGLNQY